MSEEASPGSFPPDRRKFSRAEYLFPVAYRVESPFSVREKFGQEERQAMAQNISETGMSLSAEDDIPEASMISLRFKIINPTALEAAEREREFDLNGEIRNNFPGKDKKRQLGVRFLNISKEERIFIARYVKGRGAKA